VFKVLVANRFSQDSLLHLRRATELDIHVADDMTEMKSEWPTANGLLIRSGTKVSKELLAKMPELKVVISATSGFDHIDLKTCSEKNITVMHTPEANAQSAAELAWGMIIASQRKFHQANKQTASGNWNRATLIGRELRGHTLGIIGLGRIGRRVYQMARAFEMPIRVHDPYVDQSQFPDITFMGFEEVVRKSDIVTFHVPLTTETKHMIKESTLDWFNVDSTLVNISRGDVICMSSLLHYLADNPNFTVALDVFPAEPLPKDSALLNYKNVFCTPHIGATTEQAVSRASLEAVSKMIGFVQKGQISDPLPPNALWAEKLL